MTAPLDPTIRDAIGNLSRSRSRARYQTAIRGQVAKIRREWERYAARREREGFSAPPEPADEQVTALARLRVLKREETFRAIDRALYPRSAGDVLAIASGAVSTDPKTSARGIAAGGLGIELLAAPFKMAGGIQSIRDVARDVRARLEGEDVPAWQTALAALGVGSLGAIRSGVKAAGEGARAARALESAAIRLDDGRIFRGVLHSDARDAAKDAGVAKELIEQSEDGFVTPGGAFLDREAASRAIRAGEGPLEAAALQLPAEPVDPGAAARAANLPTSTRTVYHYSQAARDVIDPSKTGTNVLMKGAERARADRVPSAFFYTDISKPPELGVGQVLHRADVTGAWLNADELPPEFADLKGSELERAAKAAGYTGLESPSRGVVSSFYPVTPSAVGQPIARTGTTPYEAPTYERRFTPERRKAFAEILERHKSGGSTVDLKTGKPITKGYAVSPYKDREFLSLAPPTMNDLRVFADRNRDLLDKPGHTIGTWFDEANNRHVLDVVITEKNRYRALRIGREGKQDAIFDLGTFEEVKVPGAEEMSAFAERFPTVARRAEKSPEYLDKAYERYNRWLGKSQVTEPVYHGTTAKFQQFGKTGDIGFHFGTQGQAASRLRRTMASPVARGKHIGEYMIRAENPLRLEDLGAWGQDVFAGAIVDDPKIGEVLDKRLRARLRPGEQPSGPPLAGHYTELQRALNDEIDAKIGPMPELVSWREGMPGGYTSVMGQSAYTEASSKATMDWIKRRQAMRWDALRQVLKDAGYDSIVYHNTGEPTGVHGEFADSYIVLDPTQIKSTRNVGGFKLDDPRFRYGIGIAVGGSAAAAAERDPEGSGMLSAATVLTGVPAFRNPVAKRLAGFLRGDEVARLASRASRDIFGTAAKKLPPAETLASASLAGAPKLGWYANSARALVETFGPDAPRFAALLASLSPQIPVERNLETALEVWDAWQRAGRPADALALRRVIHAIPDARTQSRAQNAFRALSADDPTELVLSGPKVQSFYRNLIGDTERVTLDTWMAQLANIDPTRLAGIETVSRGVREAPGAYVAYSARAREAADYLTKRTGRTWTPDEVQETAWSWTKAMSELHDPASAGAHPSQLTLPGAGMQWTALDVPPDVIRQVPDFSSLLNRGRFADLVGRMDLPTPTPAPYTAPPAAWTSLIDPDALQQIARNVERSRLGRYAFGIAPLAAGAGGGLLARQMAREQQRQQL
jgi:hypothetical protein